MIKRSWSILFLAIVLFSCKPNAQKSLSKLQKLSGDWISTGNTIVYHKWKPGNNKLSGFSFSPNRQDTLYISCFEFKIKQDTLLLFLQPCKTNAKPKIYKQTKQWLDKYTFETEKDIYPFRITIDLINDTLWRYKQENNKGNKVIAFEMKKVKP